MVSQARLVDAGIALKTWYETISGERRVLSAAAQEALMSHCVRFCLLLKEAEGLCTPKAHHFIHLTQSISKSGNPRFHSCHDDEAYNGVLKKIGQLLHPLKFSETLFERLLAAEDLARAAAA